MGLLVCLKSMKIHKASVWAIRWSCYGDFLVSCGVDGAVILWGPSLSSFIYSTGKKYIIQRNSFQNWNCLTYVKTFYFRGTFRTMDWSINFNRFCSGTFFREAILCKIIFSKLSKIILLYENRCLNNLASEVKCCKFSKNGFYLASCTRDKTLWVWEKTSIGDFQCLYVLSNHESDIKGVIWHPKFSYLTTCSYDGLLRILQKKKKGIILIKSLNYRYTTLWDFSFDECGNLIFFCSGRGEIFILPYVAQLIPEKKIWKKEKHIFIFLSMSRYSLITLAFSNTSSLALVSGEEENLLVFKNSEIWGEKKKEIPLISYGTIKNKFWTIAEKKIFRSHQGDVTKCIWHPKNDKIFATCSEDTFIRIWSFSFFYFEL